MGFTTEFQKWVHKPRENASNVFDLHHNMQAKFAVSMWDEKRGKVHLKDVYHSVDKLLQIEECLTCTSINGRLPSMLGEVVRALDVYEGPQDTTPLPHGDYADDTGIYVREPSPV